MLSNTYFLAKFRFDTAENEPAKNLQNFRKMHFRKMHFRKMLATCSTARLSVERTLPPSLLSRFGCSPDAAWDTAVTYGPEMELS